MNDDELVMSFKNDVKNGDGYNYHNFYIDFSRKAILEDGAIPVVYPFSQITSYEPIKEGHSETKKHGIARALIGGALAGGAGAIVGATTGGKSFDFLTKLGVMITLSVDDDIYTIEFLFLNSKQKSNGWVANEYLNRFNKTCSVLDSVVATNNSRQAQVHPAIDPADEIAKFKKLLDDGTITQEEFDAKKKQLLGL